VVTHARADATKRPTPEAMRVAQVHMQKARSLYDAGNYPDAIAELETARALDPYAKDLVFNLGIVHEKALHIEEALHFYRLYLDMDLEAAERARAEVIVKRLEGARSHVQPTATAASSTTPTSTVVVVSGTPHGRMDGLTVVSGILALGGYGVGIGFGITALNTMPARGLTTSETFTYAQLQSQVDTAHLYAIIADIGFATGVLFTAVTLGVFFGRTKKVDAPRVMFVPQLGGFGVGGSF
jgi:tetratricopeptide (TPR) repeat protein